MRIFIFAALFFAGILCVGKEWTLCRQSQPGAVIVCQSNAPVQEQFAAQELARFLKLATGADFRIVPRPSQQPDTVHLYIGAKPEHLAGLGRDGILIQNLPDGLRLAGVPPRGTLYAVFTFLEDQLGFRFWSGKQVAFLAGANGKRSAPIPLDDAEIRIPPHTPDLAVSVKDLRYTPPFELREPYWGTNLNDPDWCVRNKVIGRITKTGNEDSRYGGHIDILGHIQSFWYWLPPQRYFARHPEYYSMIDGMRNWKNPKGKLWADRQTQLCMTNPAVAEEIAAQMLQKLRRSSGRSVGASVAPNDWNNPCQCPECQKIYRQEGSPSGALLLLVNRIAEKVHREFPDAEIHTGAYLWYQEPPQHIRPARNVVVWFVTQGMNLCEKYDTERNHTLLNRLRRWAKVCDGRKLYVWDHGANWEHYLVPFPDLHRWQSSMRLYRDLGVKGVWFLGAYSTPNMELAVLRNWLMAKLCWDPSQEVEPLIRRFLSEYYEDAAPWIGQYIKMYHTAYLQSNQSFNKWRWSPLADCRFLSPRLLFQSYRLIDRAMLAVKGNAVLERRVARVRLSLWYLFLLRYDELKATALREGYEWPFPDGMPKLLAAFDRTLPQVGILSFSEGARSFWPTVTERARMPETLPPPPGCESLAPEEWSLLTPDNFHGPAGAVAERVADPAVPGGRALRLLPEKSEPVFNRACWNIPLHILARETGRNIRMKLLVKVDRGDSSGAAFLCGVRYRANRLQVDVSQIPDGEYHWYDLGEVENPCDWTHLWFKVPCHPRHVRSVTLGGVALILGGARQK